MKTKGNIIIELEKDEKPSDYIHIEGIVTVMYNNFSHTYHSKPDFEDFWDKFYQFKDFSFNYSYDKLKKYLISFIDGKDLKRISKKTGVPELRLYNFVTFNEISDTNLKKILQAYELKVRVDFSPTNWKIGNLSEVYDWIQDQARKLVKGELAYQIHKRTGLNYGSVNMFVNGGILPLVKLGKVINFKISV